MAKDGEKQTCGTSETDSVAGAPVRDDSRAPSEPDGTFGNWTAEQKAAYRERLARMREGYDYAELIKYHELPRLTRVQAFRDLTMIHRMLSSFQDEPYIGRVTTRPSEFLALLRRRLDIAAGRPGRG
jgi:hypothetical protein